MSRLARVIVRAAALVVPDRDRRARYREQWLADVEGAAELHLSPVRLAMGAMWTAIRFATTDRRSAAVLLRAPLMPSVGPRARRRVGVAQLVLALPYAWTLAFYAYARFRLDVSYGELVECCRHQPGDLLVDWFTPFWFYGPAMYWLAFWGWVVSAMLVPVGLVLAIGGRGWSRRLPLAGALAGVAVSLLAVSEFGLDLRTWLLD
jgi:hypothetical protein